MGVWCRLGEDGGMIRSGQHYRWANGFLGLGKEKWRNSKSGWWFLKGGRETISQELDSLIKAGKPRVKAGIREETNKPRLLICFKVVHSFKGNPKSIGNP